MSVPLHLVVPKAQMHPGILGVYEGHARRLQRTTLLDRAAGSVHVGYCICALDAGGEIDRCIHAYEKSFYVLSGELELERDGHLVSLSKDDYGLVPVGTAYALRNTGSRSAQWVEVCAPQPKAAGGWQDTFFLGGADWNGATAMRDLKDPRTTLLGHYDGTMPAGTIMHGDLRGFSVKRFIEREFGAIHLTMFTVEFAKGGICNHHDHAFEEAYLVLEGDVDIVFDGCAYTLRTGDFAWTGVGSRHAFFPVEGRSVRWLEIQAPQPPAQFGNRWHSRWEYLAQLTSAGKAERS
jgi:mannose-6-phosphate isomerase-like protein (cupin superfamily)